MTYEDQTNQNWADEPDEPTMSLILEWIDTGICQTTDGCWVELDGYCSHGHASWLIQLGLI